MDPPVNRRRGGTLYMPFPAKNVTPSADDEKPVDVIRSKSCRYTVGGSELKGRRPTMEDASVVHGCFTGKDDYDLFCVFDGHGSRHSAAYCAQHLPERLAKKLKDGARPDTALRDTFVQVAEELKPTTKGNGTTAAVALIIKKKLWVANVGDSRVVLCRGRTSAVEVREKERKVKEEEKQRLAKEEAEKQEKEKLEKEKKKQEKKERKEKKEKEKASKEKETNEGEGGGGAGGKRPMERKERSCSKSLCLDRGSSPSSSPGPSSPLVGKASSPTKTSSSSSSSVSFPSNTTTRRENEDKLCSPPSSGPSSSSGSSILRKKKAHTYSSPAPENTLPKLSKAPNPSGEGGGKGGKKEEEAPKKEKEFDSDEDSNDDSNVDPFASEGEGEVSNDDSALSDPFKSSEEEGDKNNGGRGSDGEDSNDDSAISDPFGSDGSNDDSAISDPFGSDGSNDDSAISDPFGDCSDNDNPDSDIIMSDCEEEEEEEDPIPDYMASRLSYDHRPDSVSEQERIKALGGVIVNGRVGGQLAVTRAIGDAQLFPFVCPEPYISETELRNDDEFIVIACDGLFDVFPDDVVVTIARGEKDPVKASERLSRQAYGAGSTDNISVVVVRLLN